MKTWRFIASDSHWFHDPRPHILRRVAICLAMLVGALLAPGLAQADQNVHVVEGSTGKHGLDQPMWLEPDFDGPQMIKVFHDRLPNLWLSAMDQPDLDTRRLAAEAVAQAQALGMTGLEPLIQRMIADLADTKAPPLLRATLVNSLAKLDAKASAQTMAGLLTEQDAPLLCAVDAALAKWDYQPARELWLQRLAKLEPASVQYHSAMQALGLVREPKVIEPARKVVANRMESDATRLVAARALGSAASIDQETLAEQLAAGNHLERACAAAMLHQHSSSKAVALLLKLTLDGEPTVSVLALQRILSLNPKLLDTEHARKLAENPDAHVRKLLIEILARQSTPQAVTDLANRLDDLNPANRVLAREYVIAYGRTKELNIPVRQAALAALGQTSWRAQEQAAYIVAAMDDKSAADRLVQLLRAERGEARLAAIVALRRLAVPATYPQMLKRAEQLTAGPIWPKEDGPKLVLLEIYAEEISQLFQTLGLHRYTQADSLMRRYIPKNSFPTSSRAAAFWALGLLHENKVDESLASQFTGRLSDTNPLNPEMNEVRQMSAIGLGRMKAKSQLGALQKFYKEEESSKNIGGSCRWAIIAITGQTLPPLPTIRIKQTGWFLEPNEI